MKRIISAITSSKFLSSSRNTNTNSLYDEYNENVNWQLTWNVIHENKSNQPNDDTIDNNINNNNNNNNKINNGNNDKNNSECSTSSSLPNKQMSPLHRGWMQGSIFKRWFYIFGGVGHKPGGSMVCLNDLYRLNLDTYEWEEIPIPENDLTTPVKRCSHSVTITDDGNMWVFGGFNGQSLMTPIWHCYPVHRLPSSPLQKLNNSSSLPSSSRWDCLPCWSQFSDIQTRESEEHRVPQDVEVGLLSGSHIPEREGHSACVWNRDKIVVFGGNVGDDVSNDLYIFNTSKKTIQKISSEGPEARVDHACCIQDDKMFLIGGDTEDFYFNDIWCFDLVLLKWTKIITSASFSRRSGHAAVFCDRNTILIFGGRRPRLSFSDLWAFSIDEQKSYLLLKGRTDSSEENNEKDHYEEIESTSDENKCIPDNRFACAYVMAEDQFLIFGGKRSATEAFNDTWSLKFGVFSTFYQDVQAIFNNELGQRIL